MRSRRKGTDGGHKKFERGARVRPKGAPRFTPGKHGKGGGDQGPVSDTQKGGA